MIFGILLLLWSVLGAATFFAVGEEGYLNECNTIQFIFAFLLGGPLLWAMCIIGILIYCLYRIISYIFNILGKIDISFNEKERNGLE